MEGEPLIFAFLLVSAVLVAYLRDLFAAAMVGGIFSLLCASLFTMMDAVDVAFTEASVGAGISTVLVLSTLALTTRKENQQRLRIMPILVVVATGLVLCWGTSEMHVYGDPNAVIHQYLMPTYVFGTEKDFAIPNIVTAVLGSYRGYDTMGETTVIFTAAVGVMLMLMHRSHDHDERDAT
jgi:multicomponent Na+:H+ antiporter subunit B